MERDSEEKRLIDRYLLGETTEAETEGIEKMMMTDDEFFSRVISQEEDLVEQYAQGEMQGEIKEKFEQTFLSTPEGRDQVMITKELLRYNSSESTPESVRSARARNRPVWSAVFQSPYIRIAALMLIFAGLTFGIYRAFFYRSDADRGMAELSRAYADARPTEARMAGFDYAPWSVSRSGDNRDDPQKAGKAYAERLLRDAVYYKPGAESHHGLGKFYLTERQFDKALAQFESSANFSLPGAELNTDWGAALLERGKSSAGGKNGKAVEDFSESFAHLQKALELDPSSLPTLFNLALLFEAQGMAERAKEAWEDYLRKDSNSKWAAEASEKLRSLEENRRISLFSKEELLDEFSKAYKDGNADRAWLLLSRSRDTLSGKTISEQLLDLYIESSLNGQVTEGQQFLVLLFFAGELEFQKTKERYSQTLASFYKSRPLADLQKLKRARELIKQGHRHYVDDQYDRAIEAYTEAGSIFKRMGNSAEAASSDYWIAYCHTDMFDARTGLALLSGLTRYCDANKFRWLYTRCLLGQASNYYVQRKHSEAAKHFHSALDAAEEIGDTVIALNSLNNLTELYRSIGNYPRSFECIQRGYSQTLNTPLNPVRRLRHYSIIASALASAGLFEAALEYQKEGLRGDLSSAAVNAAVAYSHLGALYARQKKYDEAIKSVELALETAQGISTEMVRENLIAYSSIFLGHIYRELEDYDRAVAIYTDTIETLNRLNVPVSLYQAHKGRLYCYLAGKDDGLIQGEMDAVVKILEGDRSSILEADDRNNFFDKEQSIYDLAIEYEYSRLSDGPKAFDYSELSRGRSLLDMMKGAAAPSSDKARRGISFREAFSPLTLKEVKDRLPEQVQIVQYSVSDDRTIVWLISKDDFSSEVLEVDREKLDADVRNYLRLISRPPREGSEEWRRLSGELYDALIRPIRRALDDNKRICIVPDKVLSYLPFESLISPDTGKYLLEDYDIAYAPSSSVLILCSEQAQAKEAASKDSQDKWRILSVGNPAFDRKAFPDLADLSSARTEAERVAGFYDTKVLLTGIDAKEQRVKSEMEKSEVVHVAAHAVLDDYSADQSKLVLAKGPDTPNSAASEDGVLEADELYRITLPRTRLVVLSSCHSGVDRYYKGEGMLSLARPFIAAGVPLVVASLWKVDSESTARLMIDFHQYRREGRKMSSVKALKEAKLKMMTQGQEIYRHPYFWAPFVAIGGHVDY